MVITKSLNWSRTVAKGYTSESLNWCQQPTQKDNYGEKNIDLVCMISSLQRKIFSLVNMTERMPSSYRNLHGKCGFFLSKRLHGLPFLVSHLYLVQLTSKAALAFPDWKKQCLPQRGGGGQYFRYTSVKKRSGR